MRYLILLFLLLSGCYSPDQLTDAQIQAVAESCKEHGKVLEVFKGATNYAKCVEK